MIIQYSISQTAKEISSYCYIVSLTGLMEDSKNLNQEAEAFKKDTDHVIDTVVKLYDAIDQGSENISGSVAAIPENEDLISFAASIQDTTNVTYEEFGNMVAAANTMMEAGGDYFRDPKRILKGLGTVAKDTAFNKAKSYLVAAPISKALVRDQILLYGTDSRGRDILECLGVVGGLEGLSFTGSTLFHDGKTIIVQVSYSMKVEYPGFDQKEFHFVQSAATKAWGSGD